MKNQPNIKASTLGFPASRCIALVGKACPMASNDLSDVDNLVESLACSLHNIQMTKLTSFFNHTL